jgi:hypothetical protein
MNYVLARSPIRICDGRDVCGGGGRVFVGHEDEHGSGDHADSTHDAIGFRDGGPADREYKGGSEVYVFGIGDREFEHGGDLDGQFGCRWKCRAGNDR